ncbi:MAG: septum formation initiator family protein [Deltaproteobacteria bacterium]|jgi:cell division protein FtsB|nr:septum formation initiator family protein [Deltaproteobacteria bacterium]
MTYKHILLGVSIALNIVLAWNLIWGEQGFVAYKSLEQEFMVLNDRIDSLSKKNIALSREIKLLQTDDKYIEQMIRKRLNFVKDNEIWYIFSGEPGLRDGGDLNEAKN